MHFSRIRINNFYNLKDVDLDLSSSSALIVGANGSGKTNIVKCVEKLVKAITSDSTTYRYGKIFDRGIWNVGKSSNDETYIKIEAFLNKDEAQLLSTLQAMLITYSVASLANQFSEYLYRRLKRVPKNDQVSYLSSLGASDRLIGLVFQKLSESESFCGDVISKDTILERCVNELYKKLVKPVSSNGQQDSHLSSTLSVHFYAEHLEREMFRTDASL